MKPLFMTILVLAVLFFAQNINGQVNNGENAKLEAKIGKVLHDYYEAYVRRDSAAISSILADGGFVYDQTSGYENNYLLAADYRNYFRLPMAVNSKDSFELTDLKIISAGKDTAIANYTIIMKNETNGRTVIERSRTTNVLVRRGGRWQIVADHSSRLPEPSKPFTGGMPFGWTRGGADGGKGYSVLLDTAVKHGGRASALLKFACGNENEYGTIGQVVAAEDYRGKRIRLSGWLKTENADSAAMWMRLDGDKHLLGFDNMDDRPVIGTTNWKQYELVLDVPAESVTLFSVCSFPERDKSGQMISNWKSSAKIFPQPICFHRNKCVLKTRIEYQNKRTPNSPSISVLKME